MLGKKKKLSDDQLEGVNGGQKIKILHAPILIMPRLLPILKKKNDQAQQAPPPSKEE